MATSSIFVITRFSVLGGSGWQTRSDVAGARGWRMRADATSFEEYREKLFADERMNTRFTLFSTITAESLARQSPCDADLYFVVLTSEELPAHHRARLDAVMRDVEARSSFTCVVIEVPSEEKFETYTDAFLDDHFAGGPDQRFATVRLDDDDALAASFCQRLSAHLDQGLCGYPVSFAYGYEGAVDDDGVVTDVRHWNYPKISAGLAFTNAWTPSAGYADPRRHVYMLGRHIKVDVADALVIDTRGAAFFKTIGQHMDSRGHAFRTDLPAVKENEFAFDEFPWLADSIDLPASGDSSPDSFDPATATTARARHRRKTRELEHEIKALKRKLKVATKKLKQAQTTKGRWSGRLRSIRRRVRRRLGDG